MLLLLWYFIYMTMIYKEKQKVIIVGVQLWSYLSLSEFIEFIIINCHIPDCEATFWSELMILLKTQSVNINLHITDHTTLNHKTSKKLEIINYTICIKLFSTFFTFIIILDQICFEDHVTIFTLHVNCQFLTMWRWQLS